VTAEARLQFVEELTSNIRSCLKRHVRGIRRPFEVILLHLSSLDAFDSIFNAHRGLVRNLPLQEDAFKDGPFPQDYATYFAGWATCCTAHVNQSPFFCSTADGVRLRYPLLATTRVTYRYYLLYHNLWFEFAVVASFWFR